MTDGSTTKDVSTVANAFTGNNNKRKNHNAASLIVLSPSAVVSTLNGGSNGASCSDGYQQKQEVGDLLGSNRVVGKAQSSKNQKQGERQQGIFSSIKFQDLKRPKLKQGEHDLGTHPMLRSEMGSQEEINCNPQQTTTTRQRLESLEQQVESLTEGLGGWSLSDLKGWRQRALKGGDEGLKSNGVGCNADKNDFSQLSLRRREKGSDDAVLMGKMHVRSKQKEMKRLMTRGIKT